MEFPGVLKKKCGNSRCQLKKKWNFRGVQVKAHVEFPWVLVFDLRISKGCDENLLNFQVKGCFLQNF